MEVLSSALHVFPFLWNPFLHYKYPNVKTYEIIRAIQELSENKAEGSPHKSLPTTVEYEHLLVRPKTVNGCKSVM